MARSAIKLTRDQREAIYQAVRTHLVGLSDVFTLLERQDDVPGAEKLAREFADDFRLLGIGAGRPSSKAQEAIKRRHACLELNRTRPGGFESDLLLTASRRFER